MIYIVKDKVSLICLTGSISKQLMMSGKLKIIFQTWTYWGSSSRRV